MCEFKVIAQQLIHTYAAPLPQCPGTPANDTPAALPIWDISQTNRQLVALPEENYNDHNDVNGCRKDQPWP